MHLIFSLFLPSVQSPAIAVADLPRRGMPNVFVMSDNLKVAHLNAIGQPVQSNARVFADFLATYSLSI